jgi:hypothetical protein
MSATRLRPRARKAILALHVSVSVALIGVTGSVLILALTAASADRAGDAHALYSSAQTLAFALAIPFSLTSLATGIVLGLGTRWGVLTYWWVASKLALQLAIIVIGALVVRPSVQALIDRAADGRPLGAARWELAIAGAANLTFAVTAVALAVFKPGGRLRRDAGMARREDRRVSPPPAV